MTDKEAIKILKAHISPYDNCAADGEANEAIHLAIKALEQDYNNIVLNVIQNNSASWTCNDPDYPLNWHCSKCGAVVEYDEQDRHNYYFCYHCGAKMLNPRGDENDEKGT